MNDVVVTVPASFQSKQRDDTMRACNLAGLKINGHRLLDEPCAAFIDYASRVENSASFIPRFTLFSAPVA